MLRCATRLETMDSGTLAYGENVAAREENGKSVYAGKAALAQVRRQFGLVFQQFDLFPHYTVLKNVCDAPISVQKRDRAEVEAEAMALLDKMGVKGKTIYSDSHNAILWVKKRQCKTKLERTPQTAPLYNIIARAEAWLRSHPVLDNVVVKWETRLWGEVPADFGRK